MTGKINNIHYKKPPLCPAPVAPSLGTPDLHESQILQSENFNIMLIKYQCKRNKSVFLLLSLHSDVEIPLHVTIPSGNLKAVPCYNKEKVGVDIR